MTDTGYCERHQRAYEIKRIPGSWVFECPECRSEGFYDTFTTAQTETIPADRWTSSNKTEQATNLSD